MTTTVISKQSFEQLAEAAKLEGMTPEAILNKALEQFRTTDKQAHSPSSPAPRRRQAEALSRF